MSTLASPHPPVPLLIAHRGGNDLRRLRAAEALGVGLVEADVHLHAGRLEVRHLKTIGPLPVYWDRWELAPPWRPQLRLEHLLAETGSETELMLDLKGPGRRVAQRVAAALDDARPAPRRITVCSRNWGALHELRGRPDVRLIHSVGSRRQLERLRRRLGREPIAGVSIHQKLLAPAVVAELKRHVDLVVSWPVETRADGERLAAWGVDGLISKRFDELHAALGAAA